MDIDDADLPSTTPALTPQTVRMMGINQVGLGASVETDNSGRPNVTKTWNQFFLGLPDIDTLDKETGKIENVKVPNVGAGKSYYKFGYDERPLLADGSVADEGDIRTVEVTVTEAGTPVGSEIIQTIKVGQPALYGSTPSCSTEINDAITAAISARDALETKIANDSAKINRRVTLTNQIRKEMEGYNLQIFGYRLQIGKSKEEGLSINKITKLLNDPEFIEEIEEMDN